jgi:hypothetical protein
VVARADTERLRANALVVMWLVVAGLCSYLVIQSSAAGAAERYTLVLAPPLAVLIARGITTITSLRGRTLVTLLVLGAAVSGPVGMYDARLADNEDWHSAAVTIADHAEPGDTVVFNTGNRHTDWIFSYYYDEADNPPLRVQRYPPDSRLVTATNIGGFERQIRGVDRVWLVYTHSRDCEGRLASTLEARRHVSLERTHPGVQVVLFDTVGEPADDTGRVPSSTVTTGC